VVEQNRHCRFVRRFNRGSRIAAPRFATGVEE